MFGISVSKFGGPEVLKFCKDIPLPKPGLKEVLIRVKAAGVNPVDTYIRSGAYARKPPLPYTPGGDGAGVIDEVGENVTSFQVGDRVWFFNNISGSYAEFCTCKETNVFCLPESISFQHGAALGVPYLTAHRALHLKCAAKKGETVLIHGASGAVGVAAAQFAINAGLRVFGTAGTPEGISMLKNIGLHEVFNHKVTNYQDEIMRATSDKGVDIILEMLANVNLGKDLQLLAKNGRIGVVGSRGTVEINPRDAMSREASIHGVMLMQINEEEKRETGEAIARGIDEGWLYPFIGKTYKIEDALSAHRDIIDCGAKGNIINNIDDCEGTLLTDNDIPDFQQIEDIILDFDRGDHHEATAIGKGWHVVDTHGDFSYVDDKVDDDNDVFMEPVGASMQVFPSPERKDSDESDYEGSLSSTNAASVSEEAPATSGEQRRNRKNRKKPLESKTLLAKSLMEWLEDDQLNPSAITWVAKSEGLFQIIDSTTIARLWGAMKGNSRMTHEKLSRALRHYYNDGTMERLVGKKKLRYKFSEAAMRKFKLK
eukprot:gene18149-19959_t